MFSTSRRLEAARPSTRAVHAGEAKAKPYGSLTTPILQTSTYTFADSDDLAAFVRRKREGLDPLRGEYGRYGNPTQEAVERKLADLEGAERGLLLSSGMAAVTATLLALLGTGDHLILTDDCYRRTRQLAQELLARLGVGCTVVPLDDPAALEAAIAPNTRLILTETPTNPYLRIVDLDRLAAVGRERGVVTAVDATFATPCNLQPLTHGVDLVIHSATKYLGGHNDLLAGAVVGSGELIERIYQANCVLGAVCDPHAAYLLLRGLKTLSLRVARHNENGRRVAEFLEGRPGVRRVWYPGLESHPDHALARRLMSGYGGVVSFEIDADVEGAARFIDKLEIPYIGPSLGGVETIVEQPAMMSHYGLAEAERAALGIGDSLVRYAAGVEDAEDLICDLAQALQAVTSAPTGRARRAAAAVADRADGDGE